MTAPRETMVEHGARMARRFAVPLRPIEDVVAPARATFLPGEPPRDTTPMPPRAAPACDGAAPPAQPPPSGLADALRAAAAAYRAEDEARAALAKANDGGAFDVGLLAHRMRSAWKDTMRALHALRIATAGESREAREMLRAWYEEHARGCSRDLLEGRAAELQRWAESLPSGGDRGR